MKTYEALTAAGVPYTVVLDSAVAYVMDKAGLMLVGSGAVVESGGLINAVGSYQAALIAKAAKYLVGQDKNFPDLTFDAFRPLDPINKHIDVQEDHYKLVREMGAASTVLLKNINQSLPLKKPISIALIGSDAGPSRRGPNGYTDRGGIDGTLAMGWSGSADFPYLISAEIIYHFPGCKSQMFIFFRRRALVCGLERFRNWEKYKENEEDLVVKDILEAMGVPIKPWSIAAVGPTGVEYDLTREKVEADKKGLID
ncbi:hypothetical protein FRC11_015083, partial [Ceratobasidium sp. 423]